jgi:hypothetical protein
VDTAGTLEINMSKTLRKKSKPGARLKAVVVACLLGCGGAALADNVTVNLCASAGVPAPGSPLLTGGVTKFWGYTRMADTDTVCPASPTSAAPGGEPIIVKVGDMVTVNLSNALPVATGLFFQGQSMVPDLTGAPAVAATVPGAKSYTFTATVPGTFLYEAAPIVGAEYQSVMGLHGALVVRPAASAMQAYEDPATAFNNEAVLVLSELDPALNNSADPSTFDMRSYAPKYFLINGKPYPDTTPIASAAGNKVLLRYVNAGAKHHSMAALGLRQLFVAKDAGLLPKMNHNVAAETLAPGQTGDAILTIPATLDAASKFAIYDASLSLFNANTAGFGGMLTFVTAGSGVAASGPTASSLALTPNPASGSLPVSLTATLKATTASLVSAAEYFIDAPGADGMGTAINVAVPGANLAVTAAIPIATLGTLPSGNHTVYLHGQNANGTWGGLASTVLRLDKTGPATSGLTLSPSIASGALDVNLSATGNDSASGGSNVTAAEYTIDGGSLAAMTMGGKDAAIRSITAKIQASTVAALTEGSHAVAVRSQDALGNWGAPTSISLLVDKTGPTASTVSASRSPNNGTVPLNSSSPVVRVTATLTDTTSNVVGAELFVDTLGATPGTGILFVPNDGFWNAKTEIAHADIPLAQVAALSAGTHTIYVRGRDAVGNWGPAVTTTLVIDKSAPTITSATLAPSTVAFGAASTTLNVVDTDAGGAGVTARQYWLDGSATPPASPTAFSSPASISASGLPGGAHTVYVRVQDAATNWSAVSSVPLTVVQAVADAKTITANANAGTQSTAYAAASGVLANDLPSGTTTGAAMASAPVRLTGSGTGTITVTCPTGNTAATPGISGNTVCTNGAFQVNLTAVGTSNATRQASKRGTYQFTYTKSLNGVPSTATVTLTVN